VATEKLTNLPANSLNPRSTNKNDPIFDRHQGSPLLRTYQYVQDQEAVDKGGEVRTAIVHKVVWSPKNGAPRGIYGCIIDLDDDLVNTTEKGDFKSRSSNLRFTKFRVQGSCDTKPQVGQVIEVVIIPSDTSIIGKFHKLTNEYTSASAVSEKVKDSTSSQDAHNAPAGNAKQWVKNPPSNKGKKGKGKKGKGKK